MKLVHLTDEQSSGLRRGWPKLLLAVGVPVEVSADTLPAGGITLTRRYVRPLPDQTSATLAYFDPELPGWRAAPSEVAPDRLSVTATVHHLSAWTDFVGGFTKLGQAATSALTDATTWLYVQVGSVFSTRIDQPRCPLETPDWVDSVNTIEDAAENPLRYCSGSNNDSLVVKVSVNRGFGFVAHPGSPVTKTDNSTFDEKEFRDALQTAVHLDKELGNSAEQLFGGANIVGGGETLTLTFDEADGRAAEPKIVRMDAPSTLQFLVSLVARLVGTDLGGKADGWVGAGLTLAQCATDIDHADTGPTRVTAVITCASGIDEDIARQIVNYKVARHQKVDGAKIGGLVGRISIYLALVGPVLDSFDYIAARNFDESVRTATLSVKPPNVTAATLRTAEVPAACRMPKQRLKKNSTTKPGTTNGPNGTIELSSPKPKFADIAGRGYKQALSYYVCNAGGVGWPPVVILTGQGGELLGFVNLDKLTGKAHGDRGTVENLDMTGRQATVRWTSTTGCCSALTKHVTMLRWNGSALVVDRDTITHWSADGVAWEVAAAAVAGQRSRLLDAKVVPDGLWSQLVDAGTGAEEGFGGPPFDRETKEGDFERYEITFSFHASNFVTWDVLMTPANNPYGWRIVSGQPQ